MDPSATPGGVFGDVFDIELESLDAPSEDAPIPHSEAAWLAEVINSTLVVEDDFHAQLLKGVQSFPGDPAQSTLRELGTWLAHLGLDVTLRKTSGGGPGAECFRRLRHSFLVVTSRDGAQFFVERDLPSHFALAHPSARLRALLDLLPRTVVARPSRLEEVVNLAAAELAHAFRRDARGARPLPPWRSARGLRGKWFPERHEDVVIRVPLAPLNVRPERRLPSALKRSAAKPSPFETAAASAELAPAVPASADRAALAGTSPPPHGKALELAKRALSSSASASPVARTAAAKRAATLASLGVPTTPTSVLDGAPAGGSSPLRASSSALTSASLHPTAAEAPTEAGAAGAPSWFGDAPEGQATPRRHSLLARAFSQAPAPQWLPLQGDERAEEPRLRTVRLRGVRELAALR